MERQKMICKPKRSTSYVVTNMITTSHFEPKKHKPKSSHAFGKNRALPYHHPIPSSTHQSLAFHPPPGDKGDVLRKPKFRGKKDHQEEGRYLPSMKLAEPHRHLKRYHVLKVTSSSSSTLTFQVQTVSLWETISSQRSNLGCQKEIAELYPPIVVVTKHDGKNTSLRISKTVTTVDHFTWNLRHQLKLAWQCTAARDRSKGSTLSVKVSKSSMKFHKIHYHNSSFQEISWDPGIWTDFLPSHLHGFIWQTAEIKKVGNLHDFCHDFF